MANCPKCGTLHMPSAVTCRKCGASLFSCAQSDEPPGETVAEEPFQEDAAPDEPVPEAGKGASLILVAIGSGERICLQGKSEYILGRTDPESGVCVDIDLTNAGAWESGVSRRHARIFRQYGQFFIEDLRSANGTFFNEIRLEPGLSQLLHNGDMVKLGILRLYVELS